MKSRTSIIIIVAISLATAALHFIIGPASGDFVRNHLMNILLPLNLYLLIQLGFRRVWSVPVTRTLGALGVLIFAFVVEILQSYGFELFGSTYDPLDIMMAGIGVGVGFVVDITILDKIENRK
jgi:low temperature requirement protein LtrA